MFEKPRSYFECHVRYRIDTSVHMARRLRLQLGRQIQLIQPRSTRPLFTVTTEQNPKL